MKRPTHRLCPGCGREVPFRPVPHEGFDDLMRQRRRAEKWAGLDVPRGQNDRG